MGLTARELRESIIRPTLKYLGRSSDAAENLLTAIVYQQRQRPRGNTSGMLYPIDAALHQKVWNQYLAFEPELASKIRGLASQREFLNSPHTELETNLSYATAIAWAVFLAYPQVRFRSQPEQSATPAKTINAPLQSNARPDKATPDNTNTSNVSLREERVTSD